MRLKNQKALITGAAQRIGAAIARAFVKEGAQIIISDIADEVGSALAREIGATYFHLDASDEEQWLAFEKEFRHLDIFVNNAGITGCESTSELMDPENCSYKNWIHVHKVNLDSVFFGCRTAIKLMKQRGGSIINLSSRSGMVGVPKLSPYASSKP